MRCDTIIGGISKINPKVNKREVQKRQMKLISFVTRSWYKVKRIRNYAYTTWNKRTFPLAREGVVVKTPT